MVCHGIEPCSSGPQPDVLPINLTNPLIIYYKRIYSTQYQNRTDDYRLEGNVFTTKIIGRFTLKT